MSKGKQFPDKTFEEELNKRGIECRCMWQIRGPKNTGVSWLQAFLVNSTLVIHQTYADDNKVVGWDVYTPCNVNNVAATIDDAVARCQGQRHINA